MSKNIKQSDLNESSGSDISDSSPQAKQKQSQLDIDNEESEENKLNFPPPEDLIARSLFNHEPIKKGAPINFVYILVYFKLIQQS